MLKGSMPSCGMWPLPRALGSHRKVLITGVSRPICISEALGCLSTVASENQHCSPCAFPIKLLFILLSFLWEAFPNPRLGQTPALGSHSLPPPLPGPDYPWRWGLGVGLHPEQTCGSSVISPEQVHGPDLAHCHLPDLPFFLSTGSCPAISGSLPCVHCHMHYFLNCM